MKIRAILIIVLAMASCGFGDLFGRGRLSQDGGGGFGLSIAASNSSPKDKGKADYACDGTADDVQIQAAIDTASVMGGNVHLAAGTYTLNSSIVLKSGVSIIGSGAKTSATQFWDGTADIDGGTIITGNVVCLTGNAQYSFSVENIGFENVAGVISSGGQDIYGIANATFRNIVVDTTGETAFYFCNSQHIIFDNVKIVNLGGTRTGTDAIKGLHFTSDNSTGFQPGNSYFEDFYIQRNVSGDTATNVQGVLVENITGTTGGVCYLNFNKFQANLWGFRNNAVTVNAGTDVFTCSSSILLADGDSIRITSTGTGLVLTNNIYRQSSTFYVRDISGNTFKIAATSGGTALDVVSSNGTLETIPVGISRHAIEFRDSQAINFVGHKLLGLDIEGFADIGIKANYLVNSHIQINGTSGSRSYKQVVNLGANCDSTTAEVKMSLGDCYINPSAVQCVWQPFASKYGNIQLSSGDLAAASVKNYYLNQIIECSGSSASLITLPEVTRGMAGIKIKIIKTTAAAAITIAGNTVTPTYSISNNLAWDGGNPYFNMGGSATWAAENSPIADKFNGYLARIVGNSDAQVKDGWYLATASSSSIIRFTATDVTNDAGASTPYNATMYLVNPLWVDGSPVATYAGVDAIGDWVEFECNGRNGWICTGKYVAP